jgi:hypothetical protein
LKTDLALQDNRIGQLEVYTRFDNLIVKGQPTAEFIAVPVTDEPADVAAPSVAKRGHRQELLSSLLKLCRETLKVDMSPSDISIAHRLPKGPADTFRPVIVRFSNRRVRDQVYAARGDLRDYNPPSGRVFINEHLTRKNDSMFAACRKIWKNKKIGGTWSWNGVIYAKQLPSKGGKTIKIQSFDDIENL